ATQNRELFYRVIAYNVYRINRDKLLIWYGFYTAVMYSNSYLSKNKFEPVIS
ncbi:hypothetical protein AAA799B03_00492, partial [Marine Group I thaumarchaeote SCGC AAA799-B03]